MAEKRYYWLKLKENYFNSPKIKKLRKIAGGDTYTIIYLKMQLISISNGGIITYEGIEPTFEEELALKLDEELDNVKVTLSYLVMQGLIEIKGNEYLFVEASNSIGSESQGAERVRRFRAKENQKALQCNESVTEVKRISISNSISNSLSYNNNKEENKTKEEKHKYGEYNHVLLTDKELNRLKDEIGEKNTENAIKLLDEAIEMKGYKYKSHYLAIRKWVLTSLKQQGKWVDVPVKQVRVISEDEEKAKKELDEKFRNDPNAEKEFAEFMKSRKLETNIFKEF